MLDGLRSSVLRYPEPRNRKEVPVEAMSRLHPRASVERTVEWVDTDASGHQHNSAVMRWVESAEAELFLRTL